MGIIKGALKEELKNSLRMKQGYENTVKKLPKGAIVSKNVRGHKYYYLVSKKNGKLIYKYKGKPPAEDIKNTKMQKNNVLYMKLLNQIKRQIKFIGGSLCGKEPA